MWLQLQDEEATEPVPRQVQSWLTWTSHNDSNEFGLDGGLERDNDTDWKMSQNNRDHG